MRRKSDHALPAVAPSASPASKIRTLDVPRQRRPLPVCRLGGPGAARGREPATDVGRDPVDQATTALIEGLCRHSPALDQCWGRHRVHRRTHGSRRLLLPLVGELTVQDETLSLPGALT
ncbi:MmyB family transcriptional regulator [Streptomyces sp. H39-S7]|uniref:MmyB family transcriptional regulator n=1 Tax=Streptomyces sp. H39-S7 TaxID=3004357 RepID=UPI002F35FA59